MLKYVLTVLFIVLLSCCVRAVEPVKSDSSPLSNEDVADYKIYTRKATTTTTASNVTPKEIRSLGSISDNEDIADFPINEDEIRKEELKPQNKLEEGDTRKRISRPSPQETRSLDTIPDNEDIADPQDDDNEDEITEEESTTEKHEITGDHIDLTRQETPIWDTTPDNEDIADPQDDDNEDEITEEESKSENRTGEGDTRRRTTPLLKTPMTTSASVTPEAEVLFSSNPATSEELSTMVEVSYGCPPDNKLPCVPKCCDLNETLANSSYSKQTNRTCVLNENYEFYVELADCPNYGFNESIPLAERYEFYVGIPCKMGKYALDPTVYPDDVHSLYSNGSLFYAGRMFGMADYCVDNVEGQIKVFVCFDNMPPGNIDFYHILYPVGQIISILFLLATAATYLGLEQFRDLQGKSLVCHVFCLTVAFAFLATVQLSGSNTEPSFCVVSAFIIQFSFVACFFWLNVLSFDTYRNIRDHFQTAQYSKLAREQRGEKKTPPSERRKFILYSIYAWNAPLILLIVSLVLDNVPDIPDSLIKPQFGVRSCWFSSETAALPYFFGPVGIILSINIIFFALSAYTVFKEQKAAHAEELAKANEDSFEGLIKSNKKLRRKLRPYIKALKQCFSLFLIMGLSWLAEIISWAVGGPRYIWVTTDVINTLQGVLIFVVFVIRPQGVRNAVKKKLLQWGGIIRTCNCSYRPASPAPFQALHNPAAFLPTHSSEDNLSINATPLTTFQS